MKELFILLSACAILRFVVLHCVVMFHLVSFHSNIYYIVVVVVLLFYVHGKHLRSCRDGQLT